MNIKTQLILYFIFALTLNLWPLHLLLLLSALLLVILLFLKNHRFYQLTYRLKWFYLVMFLIFVFNTPGEHIPDWPFSLTPTYEGVSMGLVQVLRIVLMLAILSVLLALNTKQQFIAGLYFLSKPLSYIGLDPERFAARLWLTLHYVEMEQTNHKKLGRSGSLAQRLNAMFVETEDDYVEIHMERPVMTWLDYIVMSIAFSLLGWVVIGSYL